MAQPKPQLNFFTPFFYALLLAIGMFLGFKLKKSIYKSHNDSALNQIEQLVKERYVDDVDADSIETAAIEKYLSKLDPHSVYISPAEMQATQEDMMGSFDGIGIEFAIFKDTIYALNILDHGPSFKAGVQTGDQIIKVNDTVLSGKKDLNSDEVIQHLRGLGGSKVKLTIRRADNSLVQVTVTRGPIPLKCIDAAYMLNPTDAYVKLNRFSATTKDEFESALGELKVAGMKNLVLDLRDNPGGYLDAALFIADELIGGTQKLVYTKGKHYKSESYFSKSGGKLEQGKIAILVNENSASASEILAGIVQDLDRGVVIGRRTFGKGLVQEEYPLANGGALRLTIARYYLPSGRSIQRKYNEDFDNYYHDAETRYNHGELNNKDSIKLADTTAYKTTKGRNVYAQSGISPDEFVAIDTTSFSSLRGLFSNDNLRNIAIAYTRSHYKQLKAYDNYITFSNAFNLTDTDLQFYLSQFNLQKALAGQQSKNDAKTYIKMQIARSLFGAEAYFYLLNQKDKAIQKAQDSFKKAA